MICYHDPLLVGEFKESESTVHTSYTVTETVTPGRLKTIRRTESVTKPVEGGEVTRSKMVTEIVPIDGKTEIDNQESEQDSFTETSNHYSVWWCRECGAYAKIDHANRLDDTPVLGDWSVPPRRADDGV